MFKYKNEAELQALTPIERDTYAAEKRQHEAKLNADAIEDATKDLAKAADLTEIRESINLIKDMGANSNASPMKAILSEIKEKSASIKSMVKATDGSEIVVKALTNRGAITGNDNAFDIPEIGQIATRRLAMYDVFPKQNHGNDNENGVVRYYDWDEATIVRGAAMVAEGAAFPESTAKFKKYTIDMKKIGDTLPVTDEFFEDEQLFAGELQRFLELNIELVIDTQLANGDGTGTNLKGLVASVPAFVPVASGITAATHYDLIVKVAESISAAGGAKYRPDVAFMNIVDINKMKLKKDKNDNYIIPPFVDREGKIVDGILILESNNITPNTMVLGDRRYATIHEKGGIVLSRGMVNNQFNEDTMTLKARKRMLFLIRDCDKTGWKKVTSISAALVTLATP